MRSPLSTGIWVAARSTTGWSSGAVRARLIEIGEAVKDIDAALLMQQPRIPWREVAAMRDQLAHRYFDTSHAIIQHTVSTDLPELALAVRALLDATPLPE